MVSILTQPAGVCLPGLGELSRLLQVYVSKQRLWMLPHYVKYQKKQWKKG
jgi:hypothetical protein